MNKTTLTPELLYKIGKLGELSVEIAKMITSQDFMNGAFRYAKVIDYSGKGFDCPTGKNIYGILKHHTENDPIQAQQYEKLVKMLLEFDIVVDSLENKKDTE